jgi:hypothetical protein
MAVQPPLPELEELELLLDEELELELEELDELLDEELELELDEDELLEDELLDEELDEDDEPLAQSTTLKSSPYIFK